MGTQKSEVLLPFEVKVKTVYVEAESRPDEGYHFFVYRITLKNLGSTQAQLMSRHWIITDSFGNKEEVRGPGVVGIQPKINPNQTFEYESSCPLNTTTGSMKGSYQMMTSEGETFSIEIPEFYLVAPLALH